MSPMVSVPSTPSRADIAILQQSGNIGLSLLAIDSQKDHGWFLDSGATDHMTFDAFLLHHIIVLLLVLLLLMPVVCPLRSLVLEALI